MKTNYFSITFWFNIFTNHTEFLEILREKFSSEFSQYNIQALDNNLIVPIITSYNKENFSDISMSQINLQYNIHNQDFTNFTSFKETALKIFELLTEYGIEVLHTAIFVNGEIIDDEALEKISSNFLNPKIVNDNFVDATIKIGEKHEDLFYKIFTILNKKKIKLPRKVDEQGRLIPIPLISWNGSFVENEIIEISYELNDKYSFDFTKNYHTTEFHLNKMLYLIENNYLEDIKDFINSH